MRPSPSPIRAVFPDCVRGAFASTLSVCAYVILFSVLVRLWDCSGILPLCTDALSAFLPGEHSQALCRALLAGLLEISTGTATLREAAASPAALPTAAFLLGWGGLSVHCQSLPFWRQAGVSAGPYLLAKFLQGILVAGLTLAGMQVLTLTLPVMAPLELTALPGLLDREIFSLWILSGVYFLATQKKGLAKPQKTRYNRNK